MKYLIFLALLAGCAQPSDTINDTPLFTGVDPVIQPFFDQFTALTNGVQTTGITAGFLSLSGNLAGQCVWGGTFNEVRLDPDTWASLTVNQQQQLVSHELGHCALH